MVVFVTDFHIGEAAEILKVSTRTLRHWDAVGLLQPSWRTMTDYRLYTDDDLERGFQILVYRGAGLSLAEISGILAEPATARQALRRQRKVLVERAGHLRAMMRAVDELLERGDTMTAKDKIEMFGGDWPGYAEEAKGRWGDTPEWEQARAVENSMTTADWQSIKEEQEAFVGMLIDARSHNVAPGSEKAAEVVEKHRETIAHFYDVPRGRQVLLARMYAQDERFNQTYRGHAGYLLQLVEAQARQEGLDPDKATWSGAHS